jgi:hypothetical protein
MARGDPQPDAVTGIGRVSTARLDPDEVARFAFRVWSYKQSRGTARER